MGTRLTAKQRKMALENARGHVEYAADLLRNVVVNLDKQPRVVEDAAETLRLALGDTEAAMSVSENLGLNHLLEHYFS